MCNLSCTREKLCLLLNKKFRLSTFKLSVFCLAFVFSFLGALGQPKGEGFPSPAGSLALAPLSVGDTLPPTTVEVSLPEKGRVTIPQAGKLTLLYFWETRCSSCWGKFPYFDSLQALFGKQLDIIIISPEPEDKVSNFIHRVTKISGTQLPSVAPDTQLHKLFPHILVSHVAWIGQGGLVQAITGSDYVNENNIRFLLAGNTPNWRVKADLVEYNGTQPLLTLNKAAGYNMMPEMPEYVFWSKSIAGLESKLYKSHREEGSRTTYINAAYKSLVSMALGGSPDHPNRYRVADTLLPYLFKPSGMYYDEWHERYATCFEMYLPGIQGEKYSALKLKHALEARLNARLSYDTMAVRVWEISGPGLVPINKKETVKNRTYAWNFLSDIPIVYHPASAYTGFKIAPAPKDIRNFKAFANWCRQNNLTLTDTTRKLRILKIEPTK